MLKDACFIHTGCTRKQLASTSAAYFAMSHMITPVVCVFICYDTLQHGALVTLWLCLCLCRGFTVASG